MTSPYADLRARLAPLAAALSGDPLPDIRETYEAVETFVNAYPEIDALLARGEAAEADADRLAEACNAWGYPHHKSHADKARRLHADALALRVPS